MRRTVANHTHTKSHTHTRTHTHTHMGDARGNAGARSEANGVVSRETLHLHRDLHFYTLTVRGFVRASYDMSVFECNLQL